MNDSNIMRLTTLVLILFLSFGKAMAQQSDQTGKNEVTVGSAGVYRENRTLVIEYDIDLGKNVTSCDVELLMSKDGGQSYSPVPQTDALIGDIGRITESGHKTIIYNIDSLKNQLTGKQLSFKVSVKNKKKVQDNNGKFFVMGTGSTLKMFGLRAGYVKKFGGYVSYKDSFTRYWNTNDFNLFLNWSITGGVIMRANSWLYPYIGAGLGRLSLYDSYEHDYIEKFGVYPEGYYFDSEPPILPIEIGSIFRMGLFVLSAAVEPVIVVDQGVLCTFEFGVGLNF